MIIRYVDASTRTAAAGSCWMTGMPYSSEAADARRGMHFKVVSLLVFVYYYLAERRGFKLRAASCEHRASSAVYTWALTEYILARWAWAWRWRW